ncbi:MAG: gamma carbonic anhydrase family protein [Proteobacteria bacterium]|nr:gamma carbonic anhydrase family protein [Pseudomonadota bacterium]
MIIKHRGFEPELDPDVYVAPTAAVVGNVKIGGESRIMYGAVLDSEGSSIEIGRCTIVCENAVLRATAAGDRGYPVRVGNHVFISPQSTLLGCRVEDGSYIATGATVLQGAVVRSGAVVAVGAFVHAKAVIPESFFVPPNAIAIGDPPRLYSPDQAEELTAAIKSINFARTAFNVDAPWEDRPARYKQTTQTRSREFGAHFEDLILE